MQKTSPKVDGFLRKDRPWKPEFAALREILLTCPLMETMKWGQPCYLFEDRNIVLIHGFKEYCALLFFKGALLKDPRGILVQQTENVQAARQIRFTGVAQITKMKAVVRAYVHEAIAAEKAGLKVPKKSTADFAMSEEFRAALEESPALQEAFEGLTPGRQRGYLLYFSSAKQSATRVARVEKYVPQILKGIGLDD